MTIVKSINACQHPNDSTVDIKYGASIKEVRIIIYIFYFKSIEYSFILLLHIANGMEIGNDKRGVVIG